MTATGPSVTTDEVVPRAAGGPICFVGDGATDLEAAGEAARFIAFGGVVRRENVFARARVRCEEDDLRALAPLVFSRTEVELLRAKPEHQALFDFPDRDSS